MNDADQLTALIKERSTQFGDWPAKMTMLLYSMNDTWEIGSLLRWRLSLTLSSSAHFWTISLEKLLS